jgi:hypothetical protein
VKVLLNPKLPPELLGNQIYTVAASHENLPTKDPNFPELVSMANRGINEQEYISMPDW